MSRLTGLLIALAAGGIACRQDPPHTLDECLLQANQKNDAEAIRMAQDGCKQVFRYEVDARTEEQKQSDPLIRVGGYYAVGPQRCSMLQWGGSCYAKGCLCYTNRYDHGILLCDKERGGPTRIYKVETTDGSILLHPEDGGADVAVFRKEVDCLRASATLPAPKKEKE